jgi:hypothetical protein
MARHQEDLSCPLLSPASLGLWVEHFGWQAAPAIVAPAALVGLDSAFALRRILATAERRGRSEQPASRVPVIELIE